MNGCERYSANIHIQRFEWSTGSILMSNQRLVMLDDRISHNNDGYCASCWLHQRYEVLALCIGLGETLPVEAGNTVVCSNKSRGSIMKFTTSVVVTHAPESKCRGVWALAGGFRARVATVSRTHYHIYTPYILSSFSVDRFQDFNSAGLRLAMQS